MTVSAVRAGLLESTGSFHTKRNPYDSDVSPGFASFVTRIP
jgi:hypothetical protein